MSPGLPAVRAAGLVQGALVEGAEVVERIRSHELDPHSQPRHKEDDAGHDVVGVGGIKGQDQVDQDGHVEDERLAGLDSVIWVKQRLSWLSMGSWGMGYCSMSGNMPEHDRIWMRMSGLQMTNCIEKRRFGSVSDREETNVVLFSIVLFEWPFELMSVSRSASSVECIFVDECLLWYGST